MGGASCAYLTDRQLLHRRESLSGGPAFWVVGVGATAGNTMQEPAAGRRVVARLLPVEICPQISCTVLNLTILTLLFDREGVWESNERSSYTN